MEHVMLTISFPWLISFCHSQAADTSAANNKIGRAVKPLIVIAALAFAVPAQASELLVNSDFVGPDATTSLSTILSSGPAAAPDWSLWNNGAGTTTSSLLASFGGRNSVLRISTESAFNGAYQYFNAPAQFASADIWVEAGQAALVAAAATAVVQLATTSSTGHWEHVSLDTGSPLFNGITLYSYGGAATFYVSEASATPAVPEPATWAMMLFGFGAIGGTLRCRQKVATRIRFV